MSLVNGHDDELWLSMNLRPKDTGLPMTVWIRPRYRERHDVRIKVSQTHGIRMAPSHTASVAVRPVPHVAEGELRPADQIAVFRWAALNQAALVDHWQGRISDTELLSRLQRIEKGG
jgi:hypothetical protein